MFAMPSYEVRYEDCEEWEQISDLELIDSLYKFYKKVTPAIKEMINGKEIITPGAIYRLKIQSEAQFELSAINFVAAKPPRYGAP
jgi:hypothetical protein